MAKAADTIKTWEKRFSASDAVHKEWTDVFRTKECYNYWRGNQLAFPLDQYGNRRVQINKIHADVRTQIPSLYFYQPYAKVSAEPEEADTAGSDLEESTQLLQDTANHIVRAPDTQFRETTYLALKEAFWSMGAVEVGYAAYFTDAPTAKRPPLKENEKTKVPPVAEADVPEDSEALKSELKSLKATLRDERFYVKHIPAKQIMISSSDKPCLEDNDWVGYWEDMSLEDVKRAPGYSNTKDLEVTYVNADDREKRQTWNDETGSDEQIRIFKIWDLRTKTRYVMAEGHKKYLLKKKYKRCPLKFLRFDIDPYHFFPIPPIFHKLPVQDEYNRSREYLRQVREGTRPRYTYDEDALEAAQMRKMERGEVGTYIPRKGNTHNVIEPVQQPSFSGDALNTLTISDKEFMDVSGVGGDSRVAQTKTATQAKIAEVKEQSQDSFDRGMVGSWLSDIIKELIVLSIENMSIDRFVAINVDQQAPEAQQAMMEVMQQFQKINADILAEASSGIRWDVIVDVETLSPVSEEERLQKWMQGLSYITNPMSAQLFAVAPELLSHTLELMGMKGSKSKELIQMGLQKFVQMQQQMAQQGMNPANGPGVSGQAGPAQPGPAPGSGPPTEGPQPGGPNQ